MFTGKVTPVTVIKIHIHAHMLSLWCEAYTVLRLYIYIYRQQVCNWDNLLRDAVPHVFT